MKSKKQIEIETQSLERFLKAPLSDVVSELNSTAIAEFPTVTLGDIPEVQTGQFVYEQIQIISGLDITKPDELKDVMSKIARSQELINTDPVPAMHSQYYTVMAECYKKLGKKDEAKQYYIKAIKCEMEKVEQSVHPNSCLIGRMRENCDRLCTMLIQNTEDFQAQIDALKNTIEYYKAELKNGIEKNKNFSRTEEMFYNMAICSTYEKMQSVALSSQNSSIIDDVKKTNPIIQTIKHKSRLYGLMQGKMNREAYPVFEKEVGFSSATLIGTSNIQQCMVVILRDPQTKKTFLAHMDRFNDENALNQYLQDHPEFDKNAQYELQLIGSDISKGYLQIGQQNISEQNIVNTMKALKILKDNMGLNGKLHIIAARIGEKVPQCIVVNPNTGEITEEMPAKKSTRTSKLSIASSQLSFLTKAFTLDTNVGIPSIAEDIGYIYAQRKMLMNDFFDYYIEKDISAISYAPKEVGVLINYAFDEAAVLRPREKMIKALWNNPNKQQAIEFKKEFLAAASERTIDQYKLMVCYSTPMTQLQEIFLRQSNNAVCEAMLKTLADKSLNTKFFPDSIYGQPTTSDLLSLVYVVIKEMEKSVKLLLLVGIDKLTSFTPEQITILLSDIAYNFVRKGNIDTYKYIVDDVFNKKLPPEQIKALFENETKMPKITFDLMAKCQKYLQQVEKSFYMHDLAEIKKVCKLGIITQNNMFILLNKMSLEEQTELEKAVKNISAENKTAKRVALEESQKLITNKCEKYGIQLTSVIPQQNNEAQVGNPLVV